VYGDAVDCVVARPPPAPGAAVLVASGDRHAPFAWGFYNERSAVYRVRIVGAGGDGAAPLDVPALLAARVRDAASLRAALGLPSDATDVYRLVNSEGDRLSGLIVDVLGQTVVVASCAAWVEAHRPAVEAALTASVPGATILWTRSAALAGEEGWEGGGDEEAGAPPPSAAAPTTLKENGLTFACAPASQKTGFYADQRDNRAFLRSIVPPGASVADLCCFTGGFAVAAAAGGAGRVVAVDTSAPALELAARNAELNGFEKIITTVKADAAAFAASAAAAGDKYDVVVLDPPKLAPTRASLPGALRKYASLNAAALAIVKPGGLLITCSCSGAVARTPGTLAGAVDAAAARARVRLTLVREAGAAGDHALDPGYPEGKYLTCLTYRVLPSTLDAGE
jgi:23S rRNA G2069 N7-methylase RlmK/C1962 C5-methylase RlmI